MRKRLATDPWYIRQITPFIPYLDYRLRLTILILGLLVAASEASYAQVISDSLLSRRVRVLLVSEDRAVVGSFAPNVLRGELANVTVDSITLVIHPDAAPITVSSSGIRQIDVSRGVSRTHSATRSGMQWALTWGVLSYAEYEGDALYWAGGGLVIGGIFGALFPQERWKRVFRQR